MGEVTNMMNMLKRKKDSTDSLPTIYSDKDPAWRKRVEDHDRRMKEKFWTEYKRDTRRKMAKRAEVILKDNGLEKVIDRYQFANFITNEIWQKVAIDRARNYSANPRGWFLASGQTGCGKTHLCTAIVGDLLDRNHEVEYFLWRQSFPDVSGFGDEPRKKLNRLRVAEVLYIDDFLKAKPTEQEIKIAFDIIDARYRTRRPTIISTERMPAELESIDAAIWGRIHEMSEGQRIIIQKNPSRDHRTNGGK